jgi:hypothetical protein
MGRLTRYWRGIKDKADELGTDGCTAGSAVFRLCCLRHDVEYRTGCTLTGGLLTRKQADLRFLACMQSRAILGWWSPIAWGRYALVRVFGGRSWRGNDLAVPIRTRRKVGKDVN